MRLLLFALCSLLVGVSARGATINNKISSSCATKSVQGLTRQLVKILNAMRPNSLVDLTAAPYSQSITLTSSCQPFLQKAAADSLLRACQARGRKIKLNSALRSLPQQVMLYRWSKQKMCRIKLAARPGRSNHQDGGAIDISDHSGWKPFLQAEGWKWFGRKDKVHFDFLAADKTLKPDAVRAFQKLYNLATGRRALPEDGKYSKQVEAALVEAPADGYANGDQLVAQIIGSISSGASGNPGASGNAPATPRQVAADFANRNFNVQPAAAPLRPPHVPTQEEIHLYSSFQRQDRDLKLTQRRQAEMLQLKYRSHLRTANPQQAQLLYAQFQREEQMLTRIQKTQEQMLMQKQQQAFHNLQNRLRSVHLQNQAMMQQAIEQVGQFPTPHYAQTSQRS